MECWGVLVATGGVPRDGSSWRKAAEATRTGPGVDGFAKGTSDSTYS